MKNKIYEDWIIFQRKYVFWFFWNSEVPVEKKKTHRDEYKHSMSGHTLDETIDLQQIITKGTIGWDKLTLPIHFVNRHTISKIKNEMNEKNNKYVEYVFEPLTARCCAAI